MSRAPPSPPSRPLVGHTVRFVRDALGFCERAREQYGDVYRLDIVGIGDVYVLASPRALERALVTDAESFGKSADFRRAFGNSIVSVEGEQWRRQRDVLQPYFYRDALEQYGDVMAECVTDRIAGWTAGDSIDVEREMGKLTFDVLFGTLFGERLPADEATELRAAANDLNAAFTPATWALPDWVPTPSGRRFRRAVDRLGTKVDALIARRRDDRGEDLLSSLLDARDRGDLSKTEIRDVMVGMVFAGHETTALALTFTWYLLATNPAARRRFHAELDETLGGDPPTVADLPDLEYTDRLFTEALRLYPPVHTIPRRTTRAVEVGEYTIPAGKQINLSTFLVHRDGRFYDDPLSFRPDRWADGGPDPTDYSYLPFGGGKRRCLGDQFARMEAKLTLATVGQRYRLEWDGQAGRGGDLPLAPQITLQPAPEMEMRVERRETGAAAEPPSF
ncbi:cytochrome P450 [Halobacteriales archaeon QS_1_68_17]|nr:MAG: cytochrome P450 [Halobacteriales archaeon QS_1_68_17]